MADESRPPITLSQFEAQERERLTALKTGRLKIACDACGEALVDSDPGTLLTTAPPQIRVHCSGCKWTGFAPASVRKL
jgi:hypothetical protein